MSKLRISRRETCSHCSGTGTRIDAAKTGQRIRRARMRQGLGLRMAARALALSPTHLSDIELGRRAPSRDVFDRIVALLESRP